jgi:molybdopterin synthase catalytic subunit
MNVRVRLFARYRELAGSGSLDVEVPPSSTALDVFDRVAERFPEMRPMRASTLMAVDEEFVRPDTELREGEELALMPPVSGGSAGPLVRIQEEPLDLHELVRAVEHPSAGGLVTFAGVVRDHHEGKRVTAISYEAYGSMAEAKMRQIAAEVERRWPECRIAMLHRTGQLEIGEASVMIAVSAPHRAEAFDACEYAIDTLKQLVPVWKKEAYEDGAMWLEYEHRLAQQQARERLEA